MDRMRSTSTKGERTELTQNNFAGNSKKKKLRDKHKRIWEYNNNIDVHMTGVAAWTDFKLIRL